MPVSPEYSENLSQAVAATYEQAEAKLLALIARYLREDIDTPLWVERKLLQIQLLQAQARGELDRLAVQASDEMAVALAKAANRGTAVAGADLATLVRRGLDGRPVTPTGLPAVQALLAETLGNILGTHPQILRSTVDIFRTVIAETTPQALLGVETRRQTAQAALSRLAGQGISGFVDKTGRRWNLQSYVNMATRSATARAATAAYTQSVVAAGEDLVIVSNAPQECLLCRPWEGKVLSLTGTARVDGITPAGTLAEAEADGLFHPGCRHSIGLYIPGVTVAPTRTADPEGDAARQELRRLERGVRSWKRRAATALDDQGKALADAKVRDWQAKIRQHVDSTPAKRQRHREGLGAL